MHAFKSSTATRASFILLEPDNKVRQIRILYETAPKIRSILIIIFNSIKYR